MADLPRRGHGRHTRCGESAGGPGLPYLSPHTARRPGGLQPRGAERSLLQGDFFSFSRCVMDGIFAICCALCYVALMLVVTKPTSPRVTMVSYRLEPEPGDALLPQQHLWVRSRPVAGDGPEEETWVGLFRTAAEAEAALQELQRAEDLRLAPRVWRLTPQAGPTRLVARPSTFGLQLPT